MGLTERVRDAAREAGFDLVAVTSADPLLEAERSMLDRLQSGMLAGMSWFTEERVRLSCNPRQAMNGARSVIVLGKFYPVQAQPKIADAEGPLGRVARFAWGLDYHGLLRGRMERLEAVLAEDSGGRGAFRLFVDSGPLAEKPLAARAGLGWFGKNGCILTREHGSWVLLAEMVTDLELEPDPPTRRDCGRCRLCLDRCPTGALVAPYVVDARRCISYLTIEERGAIPRDLRPLLGDWVFGCDVCQEVCPHNRRAMGAGGACSAGDEVCALPLIPLMTLDNAAFRERFRGRPLLRSKRRGLLRNAAVALGNSGDKGAVPALEAALADQDPVVRSHAAWALGRLGGRAARRAMERALVGEPDQGVVAELRLGLG